MIKLLFAVKILLARRIYCRSPFVLSFCLFFKKFSVAETLHFTQKGRRSVENFSRRSMFLQISQEKLFKHPFGDAVCKRQTFCLFTDCKVFYFSKCISFACKGGFSLCGVSKLNVTCKLPPTRGFPCFLLPFPDKILLTFLAKRFPETPGKCPCLFC